MAKRHVFGALIAAAFSALSAPAHAEFDRCSGLMPRPSKGNATKRALTANDLVRLRDIGVGDLAFPNSGTMALSPDGKMVAFQIRQADPDANDYCLGMVVLSLEGTARPIVVDRGGELIRSSFDFRGKAAFPTGSPLPIAPRWFPDGSGIAFLKRDGSTTQVWRAAKNGGGGAAPVTHSASDVDDFRIAQDGKSVIYSTRPGRSAALEQIEREGRSGFHYDDRYSPMSGSRPFPRAPLHREIWTQVLSGDVRRATGAEEQLLENQLGVPQDAIGFASGSNGRRAWLLLPSVKALTQDVQLFADGAAGQPIRCDFAACSDRIGKLWWTRDDKRVRFFRREGWSRETNAIYEWRPGNGPPIRLYATKDVLADCSPRGDDLVCLGEASTQPRRVVLLDPATGNSRVIFDPNPEFASLLLGRVERLRWQNSFGLQIYGDVVFPVGYESGHPFPLIIVQYESRGFLRGGTGDEYPIQAFANRGYVVLSFNRPQSIGSIAGGASAIEVEKTNLKDFADRRSILSAIESGVDELVGRGIADKERIGITGLSDGVTTVQFALANGRAFAAASISSGFWDPGYSALVGPAAAREFTAADYPKLTQDATAFWRRFSVTPNAATIRTPILMQLADDEYLTGLESFTALRELGKPVDMFIYPHEHHIKWQPAHRLAIYQRNLDWFDYWMKSPQQRGEASQADLAHWDALRLEAEGLRK